MLVVHISFSYYTKEYYFFFPLECLQNCGLESLTVLSWYCMCVRSATECGKVFVISRTNERKVLYTLGKPSPKTSTKSEIYNSNNW